MESTGAFAGRLQACIEVAETLLRTGDAVEAARTLQEAIRASHSRQESISNRILLSASALHIHPYAARLGYLEGRVMAAIIDLGLDRPGDEIKADLERALTEVGAAEFPPNTDRGDEG